MLILPFVTEGVSIKDGFSHYANEPYSFYIWKVPLSFDFFFLKQGLNVVTTGSYPTASLKRGINLFLHWPPKVAFKGKPEDRVDESLSATSTSQ